MLLSASLPTRRLLIALLVAVASFCHASPTAVIQYNSGTPNYATSKASLDTDATSITLQIPSPSYPSLLGAVITNLVTATNNLSSKWAVKGTATGSGSIGLWGVSSSGVGVRAEGGTNGVSGFGPNYGVYGTTTGAGSGDGVYGLTISGAGVRGTSSSGYGGSFNSLEVSGATVYLPAVPAGVVTRIVGLTAGGNAATTTTLERFVGGPFLKLDKSNAPLTGTAPLTNEGPYQTYGGNARGFQATDLQVSRAASSQVASGLRSVVGGGTSNTASGIQSTVSGGNGNDAISNSATVSGGLNNSASGDASVVGGGASNLASAQYSAVMSGDGNVASGIGSSVVGGL